MPAIKVYDDTNYHELVGDGTSVISGGERRLLSAMPRPAGFSSAAVPFRSAFPIIPRSEWHDRIVEQKAKRRRVSDFQKFKSHDQNGLPTCWANGPAHAITTQRVIQGLPLVYISACSAAVPISGGHSGGYEGNAMQLYFKRGGASVDVWGNNDTSRNLDGSPAVEESRKHHHILQMYEIDGNAKERFEQFATAALLSMVAAIAYNWWSHVISSADLVEIEADSFGMDQRNNWSDSYGFKNDHGFGGYVRLREGHGTPDSGYVCGEVLASEK